MTHTDYPAAEHKTGIYHKQTHLFQTGASGSLPMPLYAVHGPCQNSQVWNLPEPEGDWPASFLVGGQTWRFTGMNGTLPLYQGYYYDQVLSVTAPTTPGGNFTVHVTGLPGGDSEGLLNSLRGSVRLANGTMVYSGDFDGDLINPGPNTSLYTIAGDLDITGNVVSFGALNGGIAMAGVTMQFMDADASATLQSIVNRQQAQWAWSRAGSNDASEILPVMQLDSVTGLTLRDPENPSTVAIQLNPSANTITINNSSVLTMSSADDLYVRKDQVGGGSGMILTQDGADLRYLRIEQLSGNGNGGGSAVVLTQDIADARYLPASQPTLNNSPVLSQQAADARYLPVSQPALNNSPVLSQQAADARYLPVSGPTLNNSPVLSQQAADARYLPASGPTLNNSPVLSQDAADGRYLRSGQTLRVLPAGDIGMGEFTQGTPPGTPPEEE